MENWCLSLAFSMYTMLLFVLLTDWKNAICIFFNNALLLQYMIVFSKKYITWYAAACTNRPNTARAGPLAALRKVKRKNNSWIFFWNSLPFHETWFFLKMRRFLKFLNKSCSHFFFMMVIIKRAEVSHMYMHVKLCLVYLRLKLILVGILVHTKLSF